jgi:uncharacterized repeat protein (TIGR01451 family)
VRPLRSTPARICVAALVSACALVFVTVAPAQAETPRWRIGSETVPTNLPPGGEGQLLIVLSNLGDAPIEGENSTVTVTDKLPPGLTATAISSEIKHHTPGECTFATLTCTFKGVLYPYEQLTVTIKVKVSPTVTASLADQASVEGGGAAKVSRTLSVPVSSEPAGYGVAGFEMLASNENGTPATQAGDHPFQFTTMLVINQTSGRQPVGLPKDLSFRLPPGLIGNPTAVAQCSMVDFFALVDETNLCPPNSVVGVASVVAFEPHIGWISLTVPVFNLVPSQGEPARLGFEVVGRIPVVIDTSVRSGGDYGVDATVKYATQAGGILRSQVTLWGVPGDPRHNSSRGWECVAGEMFASRVKRSCPPTSEEPELPFLTLPTSCAVSARSEPVRFAMETDAWTNPGVFLGTEYAWMNEEGALLGFEGCGQLPFSPSIEVIAEQHTAATPTGLEVKVSVPQQTTLEPEGLAEADVRDTAVTLPEGVQLSPSAANGLEGCSEAQVGFTGFNQATQTDEFDTAKASCPDGSKVGTVRIKTPLLNHELEGAVYLASPAPNGEPGRNPFNSLIALYLVTEDPISGVLVKLAGEGHLDEETLRIATSFSNTPQLPFEELTLNLFGGPKASVTTPAQCGSYPTSATFTPWSTGAEISRISRPQDFTVDAGVNGSGCPVGSLPFAPGFLAGGSDRQAGAFTGFGLELTRPDGDQPLGAVSMHLPSGIAALLSSVELCSEERAAVSACPPGSEVGEAIAIAGLGPEPYVQRGGRVYITEHYGDAPFGLEIMTPAKAGPFDLGYVTVRSKLYVDPSNASVTVLSDPIPTQIRGIPLQLKRVIVNIDRPGFEFNPTSCDPMSIEGTITGAEGASVQVTEPFQVENCASLPFSPQLTASAVGHGSKTEGTTFAVTVRSGGTNESGVVQAGIAKVQLQLPKQLSSRLPTLQKACTDTVFNANPASCDEGSVIGYATIHTPVLKDPLTGPAYLVSHGGAAFPDVEFVLQGEGIKLVLDGKTDIKGEVTYSKFETTPDAPFTLFETVLPAGPHGVLTPNVPESKRFSLCGERLSMPTTMIAQNGMRIEQETSVQVTGCTEVKGIKASKRTLTRKLKHALASCRHRYKHSKHKRASCEHRAHTHYTRIALANCRHQHKHAKHKRQVCERAARKALAARHAHHARKAKGTKA